jgi:hypothetical protein
MQGLLIGAVAGAERAWRCSLPTTAWQAPAWVTMGIQALA